MPKTSLQRARFALREVWSAELGNVRPKGIKKMRSLIWLMAASTAFWIGGCTSHMDPTAFVQRYVALHQSGDVDGLLALHTEDSEFIIPGQDPVRGHAALRGLFSWDVVLGTELIMEDIHLDGDTVVIDTIVERNKWFEAIGVSETRYKPGTRLVLRDGRIAGTYLSGFDERTHSRVVEGFGRLIQWLSANRPEAQNRLLPNGMFRYDAESAHLWLTVMEEWQRSEQ
jgi:ketosteroid isomerase-like protein